MQVRKAVVTAAAPDQNRIPTQQLVDRSGVDKSALQLILEEILSSGVEEICLVVRPGDQRSFEQAAGELVGSLRFTEQPEPLGYADAILRATVLRRRAEAFLHSGRRPFVSQRVRDVILCESSWLMLRPSFPARCRPSNRHVKTNCPISGSFPEPVSLKQEGVF